jgi:Mlc titration factor MtfA (ptsG expression regulator)
VVLSWDSARHGAYDPKDGRNLVFHEFAHKLDMLDGFVNGTPPLKSRNAYRIWSEVMTREFERLQDAAERRRATVLDKYGATNEAEFFAVATECFFERGVKLEKKHPELYEVLQGYYRQDPARRPRAR